MKLALSYPSVTTIASVAGVFDRCAELLAAASPPRADVLQALRAAQVNVELAAALLGVVRGTSTFIAGKMSKVVGWCVEPPARHPSKSLTPARAQVG